MTCAAPPGTQVGFLAKDPWLPAVRREHMIAAHLAAAGVDVRFVEAPGDIRRLRGNHPGWWDRVSRPSFTTPVPGISVTGRSTLVPGHRNGIAERLDRALLGRFLRNAEWDPSVTVVMHPWDWGTRIPGAGRRIFDCTDDWSRLLPHRSRVIREQLRRVADEADEIVVVAPPLTELFPGRSPVVVPNGTDDALLTTPQVISRASRSAVYVGSISERFDVELVRAVMTALPDWTLTIYGQLVFGLRARAAAERFLALVCESKGRIRYAGFLPRSGLAEVLDAATVGLLPDDPARSLGQSSMKTYDFSARGVPLVATAGHLEPAGEIPPHTAIVTGPREMAAAMRAAALEPPSFGADRKAWAAARTWDRRTADWLDASLGTLVPRVHAGRRE